MRYACALDALLLALAALIASSTSAVTMDWTRIGDPGNAADSDTTTHLCGVDFNEPCGAVPYTYSIGTYEVTNAQYAPSRKLGIILGGQCSDE